MQFDEIMERRKSLAQGPIYRLPAERVEEAAARIREKTPVSADLYRRAQQVVPGGCQHMLSFRNPYPLTISGAKGARLEDVDGNEYIDYLMMAGPVILGHNYPPLIDKVTEVIRDEGAGSGWTSRWEIEAAEAICRLIKSVDMVRSFQSGTEADMAAVRLARAYTGRNKVLRVGGAYHGWADEYVYDMQIPYSGPLQCAGIPEEHYSHVVSVPPDDADALARAFEDHRGDAAALVVEPLGGESGAMPCRPEFFHQARRLASEYGAVLIFDEVVTGFRVAPGGAQELFGIEADLTVLGKILTHGFPSSGALGGRREIMECLAGINPDKPKPFTAGTMAGNPVSSAAAYWTLKFLIDEDAPTVAAAAAERLTAGLNDLFQALGFPFFAYNFASIVHFETTCPLAVDIRRPGGIESALARKDALDDLAVVLLDEGVLTKYGARAFLSIAHGREEIDRTLQAFERVLSLIPRQ